MGASTAVVLAAFPLRCSVANNELDADATLDDVREAVSTLEDTERVTRRVLGDTHPTTYRIASVLQEAQATLRARETPSPGSA